MSCPLTHKLANIFSMCAQALEQARSASSSTREESAAVLEDLRAQLSQRDRDYDAVHGDNYRMKREVRPFTPIPLASPAPTPLTLHCPACAAVGAA